MRVAYCLPVLLGVLMVGCEQEKTDKAAMPPPTQERQMPMPAPAATEEKMPAPMTPAPEGSMPKEGEAAPGTMPSQGMTPAPEPTR